MAPLTRSFATSPVTSERKNVRTGSNMLFRTWKSDIRSIRIDLLRQRASHAVSGNYTFLILHRSFADSQATHNIREGVFGLASVHRTRTRETFLQNVLKLCYWGTMRAKTQIHSEFQCSFQSETLQSEFLALLDPYDSVIFVSDHCDYIPWGHGHSLCKTFTSTRRYPREKRSGRRSILEEKSTRVLETARASESCNYYFSVVESRVKTERF